jgi:hypothetical protein
MPCEQPREVRVAMSGEKQAEALRSVESTEPLKLWRSSSLAKPRPTSSFHQMFSSADRELVELSFSSFHSPSHGSQSFKSMLA